MSSFLRYGENTSFVMKTKWKEHSNDESKKKDRYEDAKKFVRYSDGAKMYSMGMTKFQEVAKDAKACYKIGQLVLVNTEILDKYLEAFHITDSEFYK